MFLCLVSNISKVNNYVYLCACNLIIYSTLNIIEPKVLYFQIISSELFACMCINFQCRLYIRINFSNSNIMTVTAHIDISTAKGREIVREFEKNKNMF